MSTPRRPAPDTVRVGSQKLTVTDLLLEDSRCSIYKCHDIRGKTYALKIVNLPDDSDVARARVQFGLHKSVTHEKNILYTFDFAHDAEHHVGYFLEELFQDSLLKKMKACKATGLPTREIYEIFKGLCSALHSLHLHNPPILFRGICLERVFWAMNEWKLGGFEAATTEIFKDFENQEKIREVTSEIERTTTPRYRAPEMIDFTLHKVIGTKTDVWCLGCLLYKLCTIRDAFSRPEQIVAGTYEWPEDREVDVRFKELVGLMLQVNVHVRPTVRELMGKVQTLFPDWTEKKWAYTPEKSSHPIFCKMPMIENRTMPLPQLADLCPRARARHGAEMRRRQTDNSEVKKASSDAMFSALRKTKGMAISTEQGLHVEEAISKAPDQLAGTDPRPVEQKPKRRKASQGDRADHTPPLPPAAHSVAVADVKGNDPTSRAAADANVLLMLHKGNELVKRLEKADDDELKRSLKMLVMSNEEFGSVFCFKLLHSARNALKVLRNGPDFEDMTFQQLWQSRFGFAQKYPMYEGNYSLDAFKVKYKGNLPPVGQPPVCYDALQVLQMHLRLCLEAIQQKDVIEIVVEAAQTYTIASYLAAKLVSASCSKEEIMKNIAPFIVGAHGMIAERADHFGISFPPEPYDFSDRGLALHPPKHVSKS